VRTQEEEHVVEEPQVEVVRGEAAAVEGEVKA